ncbi:MAG: hypothetical protein LBQ48_04605 [Oscillospiraceae bacterium]|jgi:hypothetical protein|nr:hypothetical protein [Oscillospiraceae bacterium]
MPYDDGDVKIAGVPSVKPTPAEDIGRELEKAKKSGELSRARALGVIMAQAFAGLGQAGTALLPGAGHGADAERETEMLREQRILMAFAVAYGFDKFTRNGLVSRTALNVFYDTLKTIDGGLYEDLNSSGAFSFYYLAVRRGGDIERAVGSTFAMLCSRDGDAVLTELGEALFCRFCSAVKEKVKLLSVEN